jgi:hypothetical protein
MADLRFAEEVRRSDKESFLASLFSVYDGDSLYVFGFDCGHGDDFIPGARDSGTVIRDDDFVRQECTWLAIQFAGAAIFN